MINHRLRPMKTCSCGLIYTSLPAIWRFMGAGDPLDGFYWDCACGSTLFAPPHMVAVQAAILVGETPEPPEAA